MAWPLITLSPICVGVIPTAWLSPTIYLRTRLRFTERFSQPFATLRREIFDWLASQDLVLLAFQSGGMELGAASLLVAPANAAFFIAALANLQTMIPGNSATGGFGPRTFIYCGPIRHTHCDGRQVVVHHRSSEWHEMYALNLYPGPSAKKGIYRALLNLGEQEG